MSDPSVTVNGGAAHCFSLEVTLTIDPGESGTMQADVWNDGHRGDSESFYLGETHQFPWTLALGPAGVRKVWAHLGGED